MFLFCSKKDKILGVKHYFNEDRDQNKYFRCTQGSFICETASCLFYKLLLKFSDSKVNYHAGWG